MRVLKIESEPTRFFVESNSLQCVGCGKLFSKLKRPELHVSFKCPACGRGILDLRFHTVDIADNEGNGQCSCEFFEFTMRPKLAGMLPNERREGKCRCSHIAAARNFALDVALFAHDQEQHKNAKGQREENQP